LWAGFWLGSFALGGIGVGLVGTARRDAAQERREKTKRRADKCEELIAAVYEFDHWLSSMRERIAFGNDKVPETVSPFAKVQSISSIYFPQFDELIDELARATTQLRIWINKAERKRLTKDLADDLSGGYNEAFRPYAQKREALLDALKNFAHDEFQ
jgi:DNA repair ATPase RecN